MSLTVSQRRNYRVRKERCITKGICIICGDSKKDRSKLRCKKCLKKGMESYHKRENG